MVGNMSRVTVNFDLSDILVNSEVVPEETL